ncbi:MAG: OmpA family protein [Bacteroidetes bacterium]|nr:OmpA family protein [Bacteroidota bacterium]
MKYTTVFIDDVSLTLSDTNGFVMCDCLKKKEEIYKYTYRHSCEYDVKLRRKRLDSVIKISTNSTAISVTHFTLGDVNFEFDKSELSRAVDSSLYPVLLLLLRSPTAIAELKGYTDSLGSTEYNLALSDRRAKAVAEYFMIHNVDGFRIKYSGLGDANPVATNTTEEGRKQNRRVEIYIYQEKKYAPTLNTPIPKANDSWRRRSRDFDILNRKK